MRKRQPKQQPQDSFWREVFEREMAKMLNDPNLSDEEKAELVRQVHLPEDEWQPVEIEGEPLSETIIKMRGERP